MKNMQVNIEKVERIEISKWSGITDGERHHVEIKVISEGEEFLLELNNVGMNGPQIAFVDKD